MATVLVTGGAGYIGSHTCKALARAGLTPVSYDNLVYGHEWAVKWGPLERGDLVDGERLLQVIRKYSPIAVIHFAAFAYVGESVTEPAKYYRNNVCGTVNLLDQMRAGGVKRIVFSSSCATYGVPAELPITEQTPQQPVNPYGASKLMVERILADYGAAYGLSAVALRYFNAAGADAAGDVGEDHTPETHLIPLVLAAAAGRLPSISVYGTDYDTADGTCVRDYVHVTDLADAHVQALQADIKTPLTAFNLGTGKGASVADVIKSAGRVTGHEIPVVYGPRRAGDPAVLLADAACARRQLDWTPHYTDLDDIIRTAWNWHCRKTGQ